jgi:hypothetical protein
MQRRPHQCEISRKVCRRIPLGLKLRDQRANLADIAVGVGDAFVNLS